MSKENYALLHREFKKELLEERGKEVADLYFPAPVQDKAPLFTVIPRLKRCNMTIEEQIKAENPNNPSRVAFLLKIWEKRK